MKRTITILKNGTKYRSQIFDPIIWCLSKHFKMKTPGKYVVTIIEGTRYRFEKWSTIWHLYDTTMANDVTEGAIGGICRDSFEKIFFILDEKKKYDIIVTKVKKK